MWKPPAKEQLNATHSRMQPGGWQVCCAVQWQAKRLALVFFSLTGAKKREGNTGRESWVKQREGSSYCWMCATETNYVLLTVTIVIPKSLNKSQAERLPSWKCSLPLNSWPRLEGEGSTQQRIWGKGEENLVTRIPEKTPSFALKKKTKKELQIHCRYSILSKADSILRMQILQTAVINSQSKTSLMPVTKVHCIRWGQGFTLQSEIFQDWALF